MKELRGGRERSGVRGGERPQAPQPIRVKVILKYDNAKGGSAGKEEGDGGESGEK